MASLQLSGGTIAGNGPLSQPVTGSGGTLQPAAAASSLTFNGPVVVSGPLTMAGSGTLTLAASGNSSTGVTVSAGTLLVNGSLSAGAGTVAVQAGAALGGSGAVSSPTNFAAGSIFAPGNFGRFTLGNSSLLDGTLDWDLESLRDNQNGTPGVDFSQVLLANGNVNSANLILALSFPGSTSPDDDSPFWDQGHVWTVVDNVGTGTETFSGLTISGYGTNGAGTEGAFSTNVGNGPGGDLVLNWTSSVPEPCTLALLSVGAIGLLGGAWRRSKQARAATSSPPVEGPVLSGDGERDSGPAILSMPSRWIEPARRAA